MRVFVGQTVHSGERAVGTSIASRSRQAFSGETTGRYHSATSGTTIPGRRIDRRTEKDHGPDRDPSQVVLSWLESLDSRAYERRWVVLDMRDARVLANAGSPKELPPEVVRETNAVTFFVLPRDVHING